MKVVIAGRRHGPYHHARFAAAARCCDLTVLEFSRGDQAHFWEPISDGRGFRQVTLFTDEVDVDDRSPTETKRAVQRALDQIDPTVVVAPGWSHPGALACLQWSLWRRRAAVLMSDSTADDEPRVWWREAVKRRLVRLFHAALVAGAASRTYALSLGLANEAVFDGCDVVDNDYFAERADSARVQAGVLRARFRLPERYFLVSGRFIEVKNLFRLLDAFACYRALSERPWLLVLLGDGPLRGALREYQRRSGLAESASMPGFKQYEELPVYYGLASAFIHPSTSETWGLVVNEAMASGLPVLVSERCGCAPDLARHGVNGYTFSPYNVEQLATMMLKVASDECDREAMGRASQRIISNWGPDRFVDGLVKATEVAVKRPQLHPVYLDTLMLEGLMRR